MKALRDARNVVSGHVGSQDCGNVEDLEMRVGKLLLGHGTITGAEVHRSRGYLPDSAATANGLIIDFNVRMLIVVLTKPLRVNGIRESSPGAIQPGLAKQPRRHHERAHEQRKTSFHWHLLQKI